MLLRFENDHFNFYVVASFDSISPKSFGGSVKLQLECNLLEVAQVVIFLNSPTLQVIPVPLPAKWNQFYNRPEQFQIRIRAGNSAKFEWQTSVFQKSQPTKLQGIFDDGESVLQVSSGLVAYRRNLEKQEIYYSSNLTVTEGSHLLPTFPSLANEDELVFHFRTVKGKQVDFALHCEDCFLYIKSEDIFDLR